MRCVRLQHDNRRLELDNRQHDRWQQHRRNYGHWQVLELIGTAVVRPPVVIEATAIFRGARWTYAPPVLLIAAAGAAFAQSAATSPALSAFAAPTDAPPDGAPVDHGPFADANAGGPPVDASETDQGPAREPSTAEPPSADTPAEDAASAADDGAAVGGFPPDERGPPLPPPNIVQQPQSEPSQPQPAPPAALTAGSGTLDSATGQRITERLVALHFLPAAADAQNPDTLTQAIRDFQTSAGISPTGMLDRDTIGRLTTP
jgi:hypothetical protein